MQHIRPFVAFTLVLGLLVTARVPAALAATFTVNSTADAVDANPGNGNCHTTSGDCTLRAAIMEANAVAGEDTIALPAGVYTISLYHPGDDNEGRHGDFDTWDGLTIVGDGSANTIIDGGGLGKVFEIVSGGTDISAVTIQNGSWTGDGGGILNFGHLSLTDSIIRSNQTTGGSGAGAGINNRGSLNLTNSTVSGNRSRTAAGGIYNSGSLVAANSTITGNTTSPGGEKLPDGGGIFNQGSVTLINSIVNGNTAHRHGGGIFNRCDQVVCGSLELMTSTVSRNVAIDSGGGIYKGGSEARNDVTMTLSNMTVSGNTANVHGGGIFNEGKSTLSNVTITENSASDRGSGFYNNSAPSGTTLTNTIVANNPSGIGANGDCLGAVASIGYNLDSDGSCGFASTGDLPNTNPKLGPLADNGGTTETHALLAGSPAINAGSPDCPPPGADQRGLSRPQASVCDIGAYEAIDTDGDDVVDAEDNCIGSPNSLQEDLDGDSLGDICDSCPNDPVNDADLDKLCADVEVACASDAQVAGKIPERLDGPFAAVDDDGDTAVDEALAVGSDAYDCDGDGWTGTQEQLIFSAGTTANDQDACGSNGWPADLAANNTLNIADLNSFLAPNRPNDGHGVFNKFGHPLDDDGDTAIDPTMARWNLQTPPHTAATLINIGNLNALITGLAGSPARPPMFGGQYAFYTNGGTCPWPP